MHASRNRQSHQQKGVVKIAANQDSTSFFYLPTTPERLDAIEALLHRERRFPPAETLASF